jgi:thiosulfate/3-mercaptopyruvate sulfurtransferase
MYDTLISASTLHQHLDDPDWVIVDCRFSLANPTQGKTHYQHGHIKNARYANLETHLSSELLPGRGRHPLPDDRVLSQQLGLWGISHQTQVVAYDEGNGVFAARLWWLLRWLGHEKVAVLDGGLKSWEKQFDLVTTLPQITAQTFKPRVNRALWLSAIEVQNAIAQKSICLIDARTSTRYYGEIEPIDKVAGHIPSALNRPFQLNLDPDELFLPPKQLKADFSVLLGHFTPEHVVHYCGSGVTACHNLLAMTYAGLMQSKLYAGSWSEWICNPNRSVVCAKKT